MDSPRCHEPFLDILLKIAAFPDDDAEEDSERRLMHRADRRLTNRRSPSVDLVPNHPQASLRSRLDALNPAGSRHGDEGFDALTIQVGRIVKSSRVQRSG